VSGISDFIQTDGRIAELLSRTTGVQDRCSGPGGEAIR